MKRRRGIANETEKNLDSACVNGAKITGNKTGYISVNGATERLLIVLQMSLSSYGWQKLLRLNAIKIGVENRCLRLMAATNVLVAVKLSLCFYL